RFEKCSFDDARLDGWTPARAEFVECRFAGKVVGVTFTGRPAGPGSTRIDLNQQRWPVGEDYVRLDKFHRRLEAGRADILGWEAGEMRTAGLAMIQALALRVSPATKAAPRIQTRVWDTLEHARI